MLGATLTTATTRAAMRPSAAMRSRSTWSMIAMSPARRRLLSRLVRRSSRAEPTTPGGRSPARGRRSVAILITGESARPDRNPSGAALRESSGALLGRPRDRQQLLGMATPQRRVRKAGQHARELLQPFGSRHPVDVRGRDRPVVALAHDQVVVG